MRPLVIALALVTVVVGLALMIERRSQRADASETGLDAVVAADAAVAVVAPPVAEVPTVVVATVRGPVERWHDGVWRPVVDGESLDANDHVRTGDGGEATLAIASVGTVVLAPRSDFEVGRRTQELMSLQLGRGGLHAEVTQSGGLPLRIAIRGTDTIAESRGGDFSILTEGQGAVAVAVARGSVDVTAAATTVRVDAGALSVVAPGRAPSSPRAIPPSLILKLGRAPRAVTSREITVSGRTTPGAIVRLMAAGETAVTAGPDGRFTARIALVEGRNQVLVEALDPIGRTARDQLPVIVDTRPPDVEAEVRWSP